MHQAAAVARVRQALDEAKIAEAPEPRQANDMLYDLPEDPRNDDKHILKMHPSDVIGVLRRCVILRPP